MSVKIQDLSQEAANLRFYLHLCGGWVGCSRTPIQKKIRNFDEKAVGKTQKAVGKTQKAVGKPKKLLEKLFF